MSNEEKETQPETPAPPTPPSESSPFEIPNLEEVQRDIPPPGGFEERDGDA